ncbi:MAG: DUF1549 domain-containing protein, partial [Planctomycetes bacterium]|nr:DUF1549 domain-containing protein [Planctomycetota bacterium]
MQALFIRTILTTAILAAGALSAVVADDSPGDAFLKAYCVRCHGPNKQKSDLRLDTTGDLAGDRLRNRWHQIQRKIADREMPPDDARQPDDNTRSRLLEWIKETYGDAANYAGDHWAFQPVVRPAVPNDGGADANAIDAFVSAKLKQHKLGASPPAGRRTLIRRVTLDLIGLPPTPDEVQSFVDDPARLDVSYARVVDRLLRSLRYGERWAQHWLDVIRWAETVGFETNLERPNAWHYRDWVIDS